jgi:FkbM family methyltransferase
MWSFSKKKKIVPPPTVVVNDFFDELYAASIPMNTIFDVGAHWGLITQKCNQLFPAAHIYSFEPGSGAFAELEKRGDGTNHIHPFNLAFGEKDDKLQLHINAYDETNSILASNSSIDEIYSLTKTSSLEEIEMMRLDSFCVLHSIHQIDLLKIDAQGYTYPILQGAMEMMKQGKIKRIYAEVEFVELYEGEKLFSEVELLLRCNDFTFNGFYNMNRLQNKQLAWADAHFIFHG